MEVSKITFSEETKDELNKELGRFERGKLRWQRLREAEDSGELAMAKNRRDIGKIVGKGRNDDTVYMWVTTLIARGYLREEIVKPGTKRTAEYAYHTVREPNYEPYKIGSRSWAKRKETWMKKKSEQPEKSKTEENKSSIKITRGDITIEIKDVESEVIEKILTKVFK